jgi:hypothetical protein
VPRESVQVDESQGVGRNRLSKGTGVGWGSRRGRAICSSNEMKSSLVGWCGVTMVGWGVGQARSCSCM